MGIHMEVQVAMDEDEKKKRIEEFMPIAEKVLKIADDAGWKILKEKKNFTVYWMRSDESPILSVKGEGIVNATVQEISDLFKDFDKANALDPMFKEGRICLVLEGTQTINYACYKMPPLIASRDFVIQSIDMINSEGVGISVGKSVEVNELPIRDGVVRAVINDSGYVYKPLPEDPTKSLVQYVVNVDPKGWIPHWVVNATASDQGTNIQRLQEYFIKLKGKQ